MKIYHSLDEVPTDFGPSALTIGNFDGVHFGHRRILKRLVALAQERGWKPSVLTFDPHPTRIVAPERSPRLLTSPEQRAALMREEGIEQVLILPFTPEVAGLTPEEFARQLLVGRLGARAVLVGENFRFGHKQAGNARMLLLLGAERGFDVVILPPVIHKGEVVSSTIIRREIACGDVAHAARLLGRPFVLSGKVVSGTGTGRRFLFPTLNLAPEQELLPARGVYVTRTLIEGETRTRRSVTNVGVRPTFNGSTLSVETHVIESLGEATRGRIEVHFWKRLREEKKFNGPEELRAQIAQDIAAAGRFFTLLRRVRSSHVSV